MRIGQAGPIAFDFKADGSVETDFGVDQTIDVLSDYALNGDTIVFVDRDGNMCEGTGRYRLFRTEHYISLDLIDDDCGGRIKQSMGFWTRPDYKRVLRQLNKTIADSGDTTLHLHRARVFLAQGMPHKARPDFDAYLAKDCSDARALINRAATRFPNDLAGVVADCNQALRIDPDNKNGYFLRGLARYDLGEKQEACEDFERAIALGFSILRMAEQERCGGYWDVPNSNP